VTADRPAEAIASKAIASQSATNALPAVKPAGFAVPTA
jgi:hypothetical protein